MAGLVTLSSVPYNPYNDSFARFAMQGLSMGMDMIKHKDALAQQQLARQSAIMSDATKNVYRGIEMQMQNKEMERRAENDKFNNMLKLEEMLFNKSSFSARLALDERRADMEEEKWETQKERMPQEDARSWIDAEYKQTQTEMGQQKLKEAKATEELRMIADKANLTQAQLDLAKKGQDIYSTSQITPEMQKSRYEATTKGIEAEAARDRTYRQAGSYTYNSARIRMEATRKDLSKARAALNSHLMKQSNLGPAPTDKTLPATAERYKRDKAAFDNTTNAIQSQIRKLEEQERLDEDAAKRLNPFPGLDQDGYSPATGQQFSSPYLNKAWGNGSPSSGMKTTSQQINLLDGMGLSSDDLDNLPSLNTIDD